MQSQYQIQQHSHPGMLETWLLMEKCNKGTLHAYGEVKMRLAVSVTAMKANSPRFIDIGSTSSFVIRLIRPGVEDLSKLLVQRICLSACWGSYWTVDCILEEFKMVLANSACLVSKLAKQSGFSV